MEVLELRGDWRQAAAEAAVTCEELLPYESRIAAEAFYLTGEIQRRRGDLPAAEASYDRAHKLGRDPQPGLALLRLAQRKTASCAAAVRLALAGEDKDRRPGRLGYCRLLAAQVEISLAVGQPAAKSSRRRRWTTSGAPTASDEACSPTIRPPSRVRSQEP
ncbi:hypothetical protein [Streptomyces sp. NPDC051219]|uniref:hypothetical protein n=1 Tax=Streptomyces sp. NPDC051219 TaxID=3155283 RepID=UPI003437DA59